MENEKGETITSSKGISNVFGEFYSKLHAEERFGEEVQDPHKFGSKNEHKKEKAAIDDEKNEVPEFTEEEEQTAIDNLKKKVKQVTTMESVQKTSRHTTTRRRRR